MASAPPDSSGRTANAAALPDDLAERTKDFTGRDWVLRQIAQWLDHEESPLFLLTGEPGTGKSALAARVLQLSQAGVKTVDLAWFCRFSSTLTLDPIEFIGALSGRLASTSRTFLDALAAAETQADVRIDVKQVVDVAHPGAAVTGVVVEVGGGVSRRAAFARLLLKPFQTLLATGWRQRFVVLVDAVDESLDYQPGDDLAAVLADAARELPLRFLVTSRQDPRVTGLLGPASVDLGKDLPDALSDVFEYAGRRLQHVQEPGRSRVARDVAQAGNENFLYARYVLDEILSRPGGVDSHVTITDLPAGLDAVYRDFLNRELATDETAWEQRFRPLLGAVSVARGDGLTADQLSRITGLKPSQVADALKRTLQYLAGAYPIGPFRIYHRSFAEYLTKPGDHQVFAAEANEDVARHLLARWREGGEPLDDYGVANLAAHLAEAGLTEELVVLIDRDWMQLRLARGGYSGFAADVRTALNAVLAAPAPRLEWIARLQTASMVVQDAALVHEDEDLALLSHLGRADEAIADVMLRPDPTERVSGLLAIFRALEPDAWQSPAVFESARHIALACRDPAARSTCLQSLISVSGGDIDSLVQAAELTLTEIKAESDRSVTAKWLVAALGDAGRAADAQRVAAGITDPIQLSWARYHLVCALVEAGELTTATAFLPEPPRMQPRRDDDIRAKIRVEAVVALAVGRKRAAEAQIARGLFEEAESAARLIEDDRTREDALFHVAEGLAASGAMGEARRVAESLSGAARERALHAAVKGHVAAEDLDAASELILEMSPTAQNGAWRGFAEHDVAIGLVAAGRRDEALARIENVALERRITSLCRFAEALHIRGDTEAAGELLTRAEALTTRVQDEAKRIGALRTVVRFCLKTDRLADAARCYAQVERLAAERRDLAAHAAALSSVAACLALGRHPAADGIFQDARALVASLREFDRHDAERALAGHALTAGRFDLAWQVTAAGHGDLLRVPLWCEIARTLAPIDASRARSAFAQAAALTRRMNASSRAADLRIVSGTQADIGWFDDAEAVASDIDGQSERCSALVHLARAVFPHDAPRAQRLLHEAEAVALHGFADSRRLVTVTEGWLAIGNVEEPSRIVSALTDDLDRVDALARLVGVLARGGDEAGRTLLEDGVTLATRCHEGDAEALEHTKHVAFERRWAPQEEEPPPWELDGLLWCGWFWEDEQYCARAMCALASALSECRDPRVARMFDMAHEAAAAVPYENARDDALRNVGEAMIAVGDVGRAAQVFDDIHQASHRSRADERLVAAWTAVGELDEAHRVAESASSEYEARKLLREVALAHARAGNPVPALRIVRDKNLDGYLAALAAILMEGSPERALEALAAGIAVAAWHRPEWSGIPA